MWRIPICLLALLLAACMTKSPILYPNDHLERTGEEAAQADVEACEAQAEEYVDSGQAAADIATNTAVTAAAGAAAGAVGGAIGGGVGIGAAIGAASAVTFSLVRAILTKRNPDPVQARFTERCLGEQGYEVAGWR